jgi:mono/diheme cytochrome c family protein
MGCTGCRGGYVNRTSTATRSSPNRRLTGVATGTFNNMNLTGESGNTKRGKYTATDVLKTGSARTFVTANETVSSTTAAGTLENHPKFDATGGLSQTQAENVVAFLNNGPKITSVATLALTKDDANYANSRVSGLTINSASATNGATLYKAKCSGCHGDNGKGLQLGGGETGLGQYLGTNTNYSKYSEFFQKVFYGIPGKAQMSRTSMQNPTVEDVRDIMEYIKQNDGTVFVD